LGVEVVDVRQRFLNLNDDLLVGGKAVLVLGAELC
jgi:hypothetical protein